jgi:hypothetical protein
MALTKAQRKALADEGLGKDELKKLETILDADADDSSNGKPKTKGSKRVVVYEGDDAESFMSKMFGGSDDAGDDADDDDTDDDDDADDTPPTGPKWFR